MGGWLSGSGSGLSSGSASGFASGFASVASRVTPEDRNKANEQFLKRHSDKLYKRLQYDVYLIKEGIHHLLVLHSKEGSVRVRIELTQDAGKAVFKYCDYEGRLSDKDYQGRIEITLDNILSSGRQIVNEEYNKVYDVLEQNCQEFCNKFLQRHGLNTYITDSAIARSGLNSIAQAMKKHQSDIRKVT